MKQKKNIEQEDMASVIDAVKKLIAQLDEKINHAVKKTAEPQVHSSSSQGTPNRQARQL